MDYAAYQTPFCGPAEALFLLYVFFIKCFFYLSLY